MKATQKIEIKSNTIKSSDAKQEIKKMTEMKGVAICKGSTVKIVSDVNNYSQSVRMPIIRATAIEKVQENKGKDLKDILTKFKFIK